MLRRLVIFTFFAVFINSKNITAQNDINIDEWKTVDNIGEILGNWETTIPAFLEEIQETVFMKIELAMVSVGIDFYILIMRIDYSDTLDTIVKSLSYEYSKDDIWESLFGEDENDYIVGKYYILKIVPIVSSNSFRKFFIDKSGERLKMLNNNVLDFFFDEIILTKKYY